MPHPRLQDIASTSSTPGIDAETWFVTESGLYSIIMGSKKPVSKPFQRWVTSEALPAIRLSSTKRRRTFEETTFQAFAPLKRAVEDQSSQIVRLQGDVQRLQRAQSEALDATARALAEKIAKACPNVPSAEQIAAAMASTIVAPEFCSKLRAAIKPASKKNRATSSERFPADQEATPEECGPLSTTLCRVAKALSPSMHYTAWKALRGEFGKAAKREREDRGIARSLLWTRNGAPGTEGGGVRYLYLAAHEPLLSEVWAAPRPGGSFQTRAATLSETPANEDWPIHTAELDP